MIVAEPFSLAAGVYVRVPFGLTAGWRRRGRCCVRDQNVTVWLDSLEGPSLMLVAQPVTDCGPAFSETVWLRALGEARGRR